MQVEEKLLMGDYRRKEKERKKDDMEKVYVIFKRIEERRKKLDG